MDFFFPRHCVGCGSESEFICSDCRKRLNPIEPPFCSRCGKPLKSPGECPGCAAWLSDIDGIRAAFRFEGVAREAVHQLKYNQLRALTPLMAGLMSEYLEKHPIKGEILVPVPLHRRRLRARGYNQSLLLARELGYLTGLPLNEDSLARKLNTLPQARIASVSERRENVRGAFYCGNASLAGRYVILIDDVTTSGATLDECARVLKGSGAISVWGFTFAREV